MGDGKAERRVRGLASPCLHLLPACPHRERAARGGSGSGQWLLSVFFRDPPSSSWCASEDAFFSEIGPSFMGLL